MTKSLLTVSIDSEIMELLKKEKNKSALINSYLINYFQLNKVEPLEVPQEVKVEQEIDKVFKEVGIQ